MTAPGPTMPARAPDWRDSLGAAVRNVHLQVTPDNVLAIRKVLLQESERLLNIANKNMATAQLVGLCGGDPVSAQAQIAFSQRIAALMDRCQQYGLELQTAGASLSDVAKSYGYTEQQIEVSFNYSNPDIAS